MHPAAVSTLACPAIHPHAGFEAVAAKQKARQEEDRSKRRRAESESDEEEEEMDPAMAEMMGFGAFGTTNKK